MEEGRHPARNRVATNHDQGVGVRARRAQRARAVNLAVRAVRRDNAPGRLALLDPLLERHHHVEGVRPLATTAVSHAGHHEQADEVALVALHLPEHALVVEDRVLRRDRRVAPPGIEQELASVRLELRQVRIDGVHEADLAVDDRHVAVEVERVPVVVRVLKAPDAHGVEAAARLRARLRH